MILEAFRKLSRYTFLWKIDAKEFPVPLPSNVFVRKWVPQNDILGALQCLTLTPDRNFDESSFEFFF